LILLVCACSKQSHWAFDQVHSERKEFRSTKLTHRSHDPGNGIDVELLKTDEHLNVYLNIHSIPVPPSKVDPKKTTVNIAIGEKRLTCEAYRLEGGQRFLLPEEISTSLIEALCQRVPVIISLTGYRTILNPQDFPSKFESLQNPFPIENPFQLPL
jgi:hypothetical protein